MLSKIRRAREAGFIVGRCAEGIGSRLALLGCYGSILRGAHDPREVAFTLRLSGRRHPFRMRRCDIFTLGEILHEQQYRMVSSVPSAPIVIDAGANVGATALWFLWQYPGARIHAFEPEPANFRLLEANFGSHPDVVLNQLGLGAAPARLSLNLGDHGAVHSFHEGMLDGSEVGRTEVDVVTLGDYLREREIDRVDLLKLDVEGFELEVLKGLGDAIARITLMVGEVHERVVDVDAFYGFLDEHGFDVVRRIEFIDGAEEGVHGFEAARRDPS